MNPNTVLVNTPAIVAPRYVEYRRYDRAATSHIQRIASGRRTKTDDLGRAADGEPQLFVDPDGGVVLGDDVQHRCLTPVADAPDEVAHERRRQAAPACVIVGADGTDL